VLLPYIAGHRCCLNVQEPRIAAVKSPALDCTVKGGVPAFTHFPLLRRDRVQLGPRSQLKSTRLSGSLPKTVLNI
jgi:hypothetical protein